MSNKEFELELFGDVNIGLAGFNTLENKKRD